MSEAQILSFAADDGLAAWETEGEALGERERSARSLMWDVGDWWNRGEAYGERAQVVTAADWTGPKHNTCRQAGRVASRFEACMRIHALTFEHHQIAAALPDAEAIPLLQWCEQGPDGQRSAEELRARIKQIRRAEKEAELGARQAALPADKRYGVIYADPPWRFEPYTYHCESGLGLDRAADNHYPTMETLSIAQMSVPAAPDCVLFLWATVPMLPQALEVMTLWGFEYRSACVWAKDRIGTGYWFRNNAELLLVGVRGQVPAPAPGEQYASLIEAKVGEHSAKPAAFAEMIEEMFPTLPRLELFARAPRLGWDVWGNEAVGANA
jgi:N6-adenosine-specific RNA methylase IME4